MSPATVTVFGGTGYLGRAVVSRLLSAGHPVRVASRRAEAVGFDVRDHRLTRVKADVREPAGVARALAGADAVVNAVGLYVERGAETFAAVHVSGAENLARGAAGAGIRSFVHVSGIGVDADSRSAYVRARREGERRVRQCIDTATIVRPSVLFGPGDALLSTIDAVSRAVPVFPLFGRGQTRLQPVYVDDVAAAVAALVADRARGARIYELGGPRVYTYREIVALVLRHRRRRRALIPVPFALWSGLAGLMSALPSPPLTRDQVALMGGDNVVGEQVLTFEDLGVPARSLEALIGDCLDARPA